MRSPINCYYCLNPYIAENIVSTKLLLRPQWVTQKEQVYLEYGNPDMTSLVTMENRMRITKGIIRSARNV
jgi:hypothetical protein